MFPFPTMWLLPPPIPQFLAMMAVPSFQEMRGHFSACIPSTQQRVNSGKSVVPFLETNSLQFLPTFSICRVFKSFFFASYSSFHSLLSDTSYFAITEIGSPFKILNVCDTMICNWCILTLVSFCSVCDTFFQITNTLKNVDF